MQTSKATLIEWTVHNDPEEQGKDQRWIEAMFAVASGEVIALAVAALSGSPVRMTLDLGEEGDGSEGTEVFCEIHPPWGAKKKGGFQFRTRLEYSVALVQQLTFITHGISLVIGLDQVQEELEVGEERTAALKLFKSLEGPAHECA